MKYVSVDIETTGLDPETCQILQIGAVIEDTERVVDLTELPKFSCIVEHSVYAGQPVALSMNANILKKLGELERSSKTEKTNLRKQHNIIPVGIVAKSFNMWLAGKGFEMSETGAIVINVAGKNFATFDKIFLQKLPNWGANIQIRQRVIDPAILFMDWQNDLSLPNLNKCIERAGLTGEVSHDALDDAIDVVRVLRAATNNYSK
jgi:DNA polymerase III alpha subunit (gram-positive type)